MKNFLFIILVVTFSITSSAQITHEKSYANTYDGNIDKHFGLLNLGGSNYKYYFIDVGNSQINLYNLNHTLYKNITIPIAASNILISYISNSLFDCDTSDIEFMVTPGSGNLAKYTRIYDETGTLLFNETLTISNTCKPVCNATTPILPYPKEVIFNTPQGTKMILDYTNDSTKVFGLCGTLSVVSIQEIDGFSKNETHLSVFPNPSSEDVTVIYTLPEGENNGELLILNSLGSIVQTHQLNGQLSTKTVSTVDFPSGVYYYTIRTSNGISESKKIIQVK